MAQFGRPQRQAFILARLAGWSALSRENAWMHVYRLLIWLDDHNGLVHIYDAHKVRDRDNLWFVRARIATEILCDSLGVEYRGLGDEVDLLFKEFIHEVESVEDLPPASKREQDLMNELFPGARTPEQPQRYAELVSILSKVMARHGLSEQVAPQLAYAAVAYYQAGGARQNVLGEGFEDVVGLLVKRFCTLSSDRNEVFIGSQLEKVTGFNGRSPEWDEKRHIPRPDVAITNSRAKIILIITLKWSLRHDREGTFTEEATAYDEFLKAGWRYRFVVLTNDYDLGRIARLASFQHRHKGEAKSRLLFGRTFHIAPELLLTVHDRTNMATRNSLESVRELTNGRTPRLAGLADLFDEIDAYNRDPKSV